MFPTAARILSVVERAASSFSYADVLNHQVTFDAAAWREGWSQHPHLGPLPTVFNTDSPRGTLTRGQVFAAAGNLDSSADILAFFATLAAWGTGINGLMRYRAMTPLTIPSNTNKLLDAVAGMPSDPVAAYRYFNNSDSGRGRRVPGLGPAYFTKLLYFTHPPQPGEVTPLILDRFVANAMGWTIHSGWRTTEYELYLATVHSVLEQWRPDLPSDAIEYLLFTTRS